MAKYLFVSHEEDFLGQRALLAVAKAGFATRVLRARERALPGWVAFVTVKDPSLVPNRNLRLAAHRILSQDEAVPQWARATPFVVALRSTCHNYKGLELAAVNVARSYSKWHPVHSAQQGPWVVDPKQPTEKYQTELLQWMKRAKMAVSGDSLKT